MTPGNDPFFNAPSTFGMLLIAGMAYETVALVTPLPTITALTHFFKDYHPVTRVAVWAAAGAAVWHFFVEG
jgi:hypothetical protein